MLQDVAKSSPGVWPGSMQLSVIISCNNCMQFFSCNGVIYFCFIQSFKQQLIVFDQTFEILVRQSFKFTYIVWKCAASAGDAVFRNTKQFGSLNHPRAAVTLHTGSSKYCAYNINGQPRMLAPALRSLFSVSVSYSGFSWSLKFTLPISPVLCFWPLNKILLSV